MTLEARIRTLEGRKVYVAGHTGLLGSAWCRRLSASSRIELLTATRGELDLTDQHTVFEWLATIRPDLVIMACGRVGGIQANAALPAPFIYENVMMEANLIHGAWQAGVQRLLYFGSGCMYPRECPQPMSPERLLTGKLEPTSEPYAMAKLAGASLCAAYNRQYGTQFLTVIPCTLYGPGDNFDPQEGHVISALLRKLHEARERGAATVTLWGSGTARREFIYADDAVDACLHLLAQTTLHELINIGVGHSVSIAELAEQIATVVGFRGEIQWDASQPDGAPEKLLDSSAIRSLGWAPQINLKTGLERTYQWFVEHETESAARRSVCASS